MRFLGSWSGAVVFMLCSCCSRALLAIVPSLCSSCIMSMSACVCACIRSASSEGHPSPNLSMSSCARAVGLETCSPYAFLIDAVTVLSIACMSLCEYGTTGNEYVSAGIMHVLRRSSFCAGVALDLRRLFAFCLSFLSASLTCGFQSRVAVKSTPKYAKGLLAL